ncbi:MAG: 5'/3'-nucleotidase SurE [Clostridia bacterium]|nr:5'/3'-nucleotidase SurE [Clostridia bacterium]
MHLLLVNDDGFDSPLLRMLCSAAAGRGHRVTVAAPDRQQSAKSHAFTVADPLTVKPGRMEGAAEAWRVCGTPVDCSRLGLMELARDADLVISGINDGWNIGLATYVSGTVGAAREAAFIQGKAVAVSLEPGASEETAAFAADFAVRTAERMAESSLPPMCVCSINVPALPPSALREAVFCPINCRMYRDAYERRVSPRGRLYFWLGPETPDDAPDKGTDLDLLQQGHITCTLLTPPRDVCFHCDSLLPPLREDAPCV